ncbi:MAG: DUF885 domain-containing protein [Myxococcota bacterium]
MWFVWLACTPKAPTVVPPGAAVPGQDPPAAAGVRSQALAAVLTEHWEATLQRYPEWATNLGDHRYDDQVSDPSEAARAAWLSREQEWATRLSLLQDSALTSADRETRDLLLESLRADVGAEVCRTLLWSVSARANALVDVNTLSDDASVATPEDGARLVARYRAAAASIDTQTRNLGAGGDRVANLDSLNKVVEMLDRELGSPVADAPMLGPARVEHPEWDPAALATFRADLTAAVTDGVRPALTRYRDLLRDQLVPKGRTGADIGLHALPDGDACYRALIRQETTLDLTPDELHQTGLDELAKIHAEFRVLGKAVLGTDDLAEIFARLRSDPALHFGTADEVKATAEAALRRAEAAVPRFFGTVPRAPCTVDAIPDYLAPYTTVAYYQQARPDGTRPGVYFVNVFAPETRPRHEAEVLAFHESVPGHHLQIAIAQERGELPAFRRYGGATAFVEGWALYGERLANEMGLYTGDTDRLGMLAFDSWRAARLVVDTGLHAKGWTREQAEAFVLENTPLAENNIVNEVDRYVTTPGQALAYKTGQLEILALRAEAEAALGPSFSLPAFHDVVLSGGAVSLPVLRRRVQAWIDTAGDLRQ